MVYNVIKTRATFRVQLLPDVSISRCHPSSSIAILGDTLLILSTVCRSDTSKSPVWSSQVSQRRLLGLHGLPTSRVKASLTVACRQSARTIALDIYIYIYMARKRQGFCLPKYSKTEPKKNIYSEKEPFYKKKKKMGLAISVMGLAILVMGLAILVHHFFPLAHSCTFLAIWQVRP